MRLESACPLVAVPTAASICFRWFGSLLTLLSLVVLSSCAPRMTATLSDPADLGFTKASTPAEILSREQGERLLADTYTPTTGQLLFRRNEQQYPFTAHYYFVGNRLVALAYYLSSSPYETCSRYRDLYEALSSDVSAQYGEPSSNQEQSSPDPHAPWNCSELRTWSDSQFDVEVWHDGNVTYDFERVGVRYQFR